MQLEVVPAVDLLVPGLHKSKPMYVNGAPSTASLPSLCGSKDFGEVQLGIAAELLSLFFLPCLDCSWGTKVVVVLST